LLPGKTYKPEDFLEIIWRHRWAITVPFVLCTAAAVTFANLLPNTYRSETTVLVVPQRVPERFVPNTVPTRIADRVRTIRMQILSRSRLERIIEEFDLYADLRTRLPMEDVVEQMRAEVGTRVVREDAFTISFMADRPEVAQKVTERLTSMFREENARDRERVAQGTNQFLQRELDDARVRLAEHEKKVEEFRKNYSGELPDQVASNLQAIQNTELQIQTLIQGLNSDRDRRLMLERQVADANAAQPVVVVPPPTPGAAPTTTAQALDAAETTLRILQAKLTAQHPDLIQARTAVKRLQSQLAAEQSGAPAADSTPRVSPTEMARRNRATELKAEMDALDRSIAQKLAEEQRLRSVVAGYRRKVEAVPTRETELTALTRDYETLQRGYRSLLERYQDSKVAANLEAQQIGETLQVLDPARVPERPFSPNRLMIGAGGAGLGLVLGLLLAGTLEFKDRSLRTTEDVALCFALPVLAVLPSVRTVRETRAARRRTVISLAISATGVLAIAGFLVWRFTL
jgi:protein tyrosine kinase modulator